MFLLAVAAGCYGIAAVVMKSDGPIHPLMTQRLRYVVVAVGTVLMVSPSYAHFGPTAGIAFALVIGIICTTIVMMRPTYLLRKLPDGNFLDRHGCTVKSSSF